MSGLASRKHPAGRQAYMGEEEGAFGFYPRLAGDLGKSGLSFTFSFLVHLVKVSPCIPAPLAPNPASQWNCDGA